MRTIKEPKRKTSIYIDENTIPKIHGIQKKHGMSLNRVINICLNKYIDQMLIW